jgi:hypothetical protein
VPNTITKCVVKSRDFAQIRPQQLGEEIGIEVIGLDFGGGDGLEAGRVGEDEVDAEVVEQVREPVPEAGGFHHGPVWAGEGGEVGPQPGRLVRDALLFDALAIGGVGCDDAVALMLIDAREGHGALLVVAE